MNNFSTLDWRVLEVRKFHDEVLKIPWQHPKTVKNSGSLRFRLRIGLIPISSNLPVRIAHGAILSNDNVSPFNMVM